MFLHFIFNSKNDQKLVKVFVPPFPISGSVLPITC